jgi:hypothetical protein
MDFIINLFKYTAVALVLSIWLLLAIALSTNVYYWLIKTLFT